MRLKLNAENYIVGYGCFGNPDYPEYEWKEPPEELKNKSGNFLYKWDGEPVFSPQPYTPEQLEQLRKDFCREEIRKAYTADDEAKILRENITALAEDRKPTPEFTEYNKVVSGIIDKSRDINFSVQAEEKEIL